MNVSVCLAAYNGEKYIDVQLKSILDQLGENDELIILDDCSTDNTLKVVNSFVDKRIKLFSNNVNKGHVFSFGKAIEFATRDIIFMSDQDDIWLDNRLELMKDSLIAEKVMLLSTNTNFIDSNGTPINYKVDGVSSKNSKKYLRNIFDIFKGKENYYGCAMAFKSELRTVILPIPSYVESHDLWIAMAANIMKSNLHSDIITLSRRVHGENASIVKRKFGQKIWSRLIFTISIIQLLYRKFLYYRK